MSPALRAQGVAVELGGRRVLDDVSFEVARGEFVCLCGPNGGGKTTFLKAALGLVPLAAGSIEVLGARPGASASAVGYLPQAKAFNPTFPRGWWTSSWRTGGAGVACAGAADRERGPRGPRVGSERLLDAVLRGLSGERCSGLCLAPRARERARAPPARRAHGRCGRPRAREFLDLLGRGGGPRGPRRRPRDPQRGRGAAASAPRRLPRRPRAAWGTPAEVAGPRWDRAAFSGHDHDAPPAPLCEDE